MTHAGVKDPDDQGPDALDIPGNIVAPSDVGPDRPEDHAQGKEDEAEEDRFFVQTAQGEEIGEGRGVDDPLQQVKDAQGEGHGKEGIAEKGEDDVQREEGGVEAGDQRLEDRVAGEGRPEQQQVEEDDKEADGADAVAQFEVEVDGRQSPAEEEEGGEEVGDRQVAGAQPALAENKSLQGKGGDDAAEGPLGDGRLSSLEVEEVKDKGEQIKGKRDRQEYAGQIHGPSIVKMIISAGRLAYSRPAGKGQPGRWGRFSVVLFRIGRHAVEETGAQPRRVHGGIDIGDQPLAILGIAAAEVEEVGDMVGAEDGAGGVEMGEHFPRFEEEFAAGALLQGVDKVVVVAVKEGEEGEVFGIDLIHPGGGRAGMAEAAPAAGEAENRRHREFHPRCPRLQGLLRHDLGAEALVDREEGFVLPGFEAKVEDAQALAPQNRQLFRALGHQAGGGGISADAGQVGKGGGQAIENLRQPGNGVDEGVAVGEEDPVDAGPVDLGNPLDLFENLRHRPDPEAFPFVHAAEGAAILRTADGE